MQNRNKKQRINRDSQDFKLYNRIRLMEKATVLIRRRVKNKAKVNNKTESNKMVLSLLMCKTSHITNQYCKD